MSPSWPGNLLLFFVISQIPCLLLWCLFLSSFLDITCVVGPRLTHICISSIFVRFFVLTSSRIEFIPSLFELYRYKIYIEGSAWSVSEKYILACDSVTLLVTPQYYDFFTRGLMPLQHYWPIREDNKCRAIKHAVDWGNNKIEKVISWSILFAIFRLRLGWSLLIWQESINRWLQILLHFDWSIRG